MPVPKVTSAGIKRVKPSDHFMQKAKAISRMPAMPRSAHAIKRIRSFSSLDGRSGRRAECNSQPVEGVHQADRIGEIGKLLVAECASGGFIVGIGNAGFRNARYGFRP